MLLGHHGASARTDALVALDRGAGSGCRSRPAAGARSATGSRSARGAADRRFRVDDGRQQRVEGDDPRVVVDLQRTDAGRELGDAVELDASVSAWCSACARTRRSRSRTLGPNSTRRCSSPARRMVSAGRSESAPSTCRTGSGRGRRRRALGAPARTGARQSRDARARESRRGRPPSASVIARSRTWSPARSWPSFQRSAAATVAGQTKPPRLGPSGPRMIGMSPVKSIVPIAYALSWMFDGWSPASPPSGRAHCGAGPIRRTPVRSEWWCTSHAAACSIAMSSGVKKSGAPCGPASTPISHSLVYSGIVAGATASPVECTRVGVGRARPRAARHRRRKPGPRGRRTDRG